MSSTTRWRMLRLPSNGVPKLLLKADFTSTGYEVRLTDLYRVWEESLSKRDIIRRAWDDNCSIDPSEDDEQFKIFLGKVESALNGEDGTTMELVSAGDSELCLNLSVQLPGPLPTLLWAASLKKQDEGTVGNALIGPLLHQANDLRSQVQQLISELHEKDRVISKITDRLETSGNDLTTVFPGVSNIKTNKKKTQREQLARHVKGLADFEETAWRSRRIDGSGPDLWDKMDDIMRDLPELESSSGNQLNDKEWWRNLPGSFTIKQESQPSSTGRRGLSGKVNGGAISKEDSMVDDGFQRQKTPDHLKRKASTHSDRAEYEDQTPNPTEQLSHAEHAWQDDEASTTEDEGDLDAPPSSKPTATTEGHASPSETSAPSPDPSKKLGTIGGRSSRPPPSLAEDPKPEPETQPPQAARSKLGIIGGKAKASNEASASPDQDIASSSPPTARGSGVVGDKRRSQIASPSAATIPLGEQAVDGRFRAPTKDPTPPTRETSQERADRKRDALKKELEQKAKMPAKKKRKF